MVGCGGGVNLHLSTPPHPRNGRGCGEGRTIARARDTRLRFLLTRRNRCWVGGVHTKVVRFCSSFSHTNTTHTLTKKRKKPGRPPFQPSSPVYDDDVMPRQPHSRGRLEQEPRRGERTRPASSRGAAKSDARAKSCVRGRACCFEKGTTESHNIDFFISIKMTI